ncbi:spindle and kinetochore-associated protein 2 [Molossus molossus]|uniref:spindle and kinetochore-associated protein 2 n=1 Tax=Molossus molossus TaxID=27622 RepID=UPI0017461BEF|nr:spindle and kinetochore-associated protein 2 [Molossus molossus]
MEEEVDKLELMFQKADSDLDYIQYRLEYEIKTNHPVSAGEKNPVTLLQELSAIKTRYQTLHARFKPISDEQKETKSRICATFNKTMTVIQELQKQTDLELSPMTEEEKMAIQQLKSHLSDL